MPPVIDKLKLFSETGKRLVKTFEVKIFALNKRKDLQQ